MWLDGELLPAGRARVPIDDLGFLYGAACFETVRASQGHIFRLDRHLRRLAAGLAALGVRPPPGAAALGEAIVATLEANALGLAGLPDARVRLTVTAGRGAATSVWTTRPSRSRSSNGSCVSTMRTRLHCRTDCRSS